MNKFDKIEELASKGFLCEVVTDAWANWKFKNNRPDYSTAYPSELDKIKKSVSYRGIYWYFDKNNNKLISDDIGMYSTFEGCINGLFKTYDSLINEINPKGFMTHKYNKCYIVLDLEATCYDKLNINEIKPENWVSEIIEIGAVKVDANGNILDTFSKFLKPKKFPHISKFCNQLTTITQKDIDNAEDANIVLKEFFKWSNTNGYDDTKFVSWGFYDKKQFQSDLELNEIKQKWIRDDNHLSLKHLHSQWNNIKKPLGLGRACEFEKIKFEGVAHRGIDDAKNITKIFIKYINKLT